MLRGASFVPSPINECNTKQHIHIYQKYPIDKSYRDLYTSYRDEPFTPGGILGLLFHSIVYLPFWRRLFEVVTVYI